VILQRADHLQAGAITDVRQARVFVSSKVALKDATIRRTVEDGAPSFQIFDAVGRFLRVDLSHAPVVDVLTSTHGVSEMHAPVVPIVDIADRSSHTAFSHDCMRFAEQRLADDTYGDASS
jgi:hypothetical protein